MAETRSERPERRAVSGVRIIDAAKSAVPTEVLAKHLGADLQRQGDRLTGRCPLPDHEDRTPSFTVYPDTDSFFCYGCLRGGDVVELARFAWDYDKHEVSMAAANLLHEFGHPIPTRPPSWYRKLERQTPLRDALDEAKIRHLQRRVYRIFMPLRDALDEAKIRHLQRRVYRIFMPLIEEIGDEELRREEIAYLWKVSGEIAVCLWRGRRAA